MEPNTLITGPKINGSLLFEISSYALTRQQVLGERKFMNCKDDNFSRYITPFILENPKILFTEYIIQGAFHPPMECNHILGQETDIELYKAT